MFKKLILIVITLSLNTAVFATEGVDTLQNDVSAADADKGYSEESLSAWLSDFESKFQRIGISNQGRTFFFGSSGVRVGPLDPAYAKELVIAYEKALLNMQADFILQTYGRMTAERITDFFEDDSTNARDFPLAKLQEEAQKGKIDLVMDKFIDVISNKLDAELISQGVPEEKIKKMSVEQKKLIYKDNFKKTMVKKAVQNISGLVPVQTKVITTLTPKGPVSQIGVIAVLSEKTIQFANDIARLRPTLVRGAPKSLSDVLPKSDKEYLNEFGLRYVYDEKGMPMLVSYGMWSMLGQTKDPSKYLRKEQSAIEKARMLAEASIGEFMKSNISASQSADIDSLSEEIAKKVTDFENGVNAGSKETTDDIGETIDTSFKKISAKSSFRLRGTSQVKTWKQEDKNGVMYLGSVVTWTYEQLENANKIEDKQLGKKESIQKKNSEAKKESRTSKVVNDPNDF